MSKSSLRKNAANTPPFGLREVHTPHLLHLESFSRPVGIVKPSATSANTWGDETAKRLRDWERKHRQTLHTPMEPEMILDPLVLFKFGTDPIWQRHRSFVDWASLFSKGYLVMPRAKRQYPFCDCNLLDCDLRLWEHVACER